MGLRARVRKVVEFPRRCVEYWRNWRLRMTLVNVTACLLLACFLCPEVMAHSLFYPLFRLVFGTLYPAYASYKAVRTKNVKEYVKWMMYWIVFALFTCAETFTDVFCSFWFPFYYEFKVILVLWLLSPATKGSSILYRKFVHPMLTKREQEIDEYIAKAKEQGYHTVLTLGTKGVNYATTVIMQTAIKSGGGIVNQLRRSYSLSDISADMEAIAEMNRSKGHPEDELDIGNAPMQIDPRLRRSRGYSPRRSASGSGRVDMYFPEVDVNVRQRGSRPRETGIPLSHIRSTEDVSSGYSSAELLYSGQPVPTDAQEPLVRTSSVGSSRVTRTKTVRGGITAKRPTPSAEDFESWSESEESDSGNQEEYFYEFPSEVPSQPIAIVPSATFSQPAPPQPAMHDLQSNFVVGVARKSSDKEEIAPNASPDKMSSVLRIEGTAAEPGTANVLRSDIPFQERNMDLHLNVAHVIESSLVGEIDLEEVIPIEIINIASTNVSPIVANDDKFFEENSLSLVEESCTNTDDNTLNGIILNAADLAFAIADVENLEKMQDISSVKEKEDQDNVVFFDSETIIKENPSTSSLSNDTPNVKSTCPEQCLDQIPIEDKTPGHQCVQKSLDEFGKDNRAGRYNKLPAPCPPQRLSAEPTKPGTDDGLKIGILSPQSELLAPSRKLSSTRNPSPGPKSVEASPNLSKKEMKTDESEGNSQRFASEAQSHEYNDVSNPPNSSSFVGKPDAKAPASAKPVPPPSPNQPRIDLKPKPDAPFISRLLSKPKSQLTSIFPFLSGRDDTPHFSELMTSSLTSLNNDLSAQGRMRSSSTASTVSTSSGHVSKTPELPPRKKTPDVGNISKETADNELLTKDHNDSHESRRETAREIGPRIRIREMSHSPSRRLSKLE